MSTVITTQAIAAFASSAAHGVAAFTGLCKSAAMIAGHKISAGATSYAFPAVKLAWVKFMAMAPTIVPFLSSPLGLSLIGAGAGAFTATVGVTLVLVSRSDKLGDDNSVARRVALCSGVVLGITGVIVGIGGGIGALAVLI